MAIPVSLSAIVQEMDIMSDELTTFLVRSTGEMVTISDEAFRAAEAGKDVEGFPDWQQEMIRIAADILEHEENYVSLPSKFDIHEYDIMERFCRTIEDDRTAEVLFSAIKGRGAFGRFREGIHRYDLEKEWDAFREEAFKEIAREWCEENGIEYGE